jgi:hypothetical protein
MKLSYREDGMWVAHSHPATFRTEVMGGGSLRVVAGVPAGDALTFQRLAGSLESPCMLLYVLHTPRGEGNAGRYQSPPLAPGELASFLDQYAAFLAGDARFDLWVHSPSEKATLVWDRHNLIYAYGPTGRFVSTLEALGFDEGSPGLFFEHMHHYRQEFDSDAAAVLQAFAWSHSPLQPDDEQ